MGISNSNGDEIAVDVEYGEVNNGTVLDKSSKKKSLSKLVSGVLNGLSTDKQGIELDSQETTRLLVDQEQLLPLVNNSNDNEKEIQKFAKSNKPGKPPRHPKGPTLDASDMRLIKEISKFARKKRERIERYNKTLKNKAAETPSPSPSSPPPPPSSSVRTISAMIITVLFFLVIVFQGMCPSGSSETTFAGASQPAPDMTSFPPLNA